VIESIISAINRHANSLLFIEIGLLVLLLVLFIGTWIYNKKKYQNLKHQIPADVVKTYLDSIIHNSAALKSSLFRGGGDGVDASQIPSVLPVGGLGGGDSVGVSDGNVSSAELNAKIAEIARLKAELDNKNNQVADLEKKLAQTQEELDKALARIAELEKLLAESGSGDDTVLREQLNATIKERDELRDKLKEYGVIEDDLANLKRYKQENELLRKALEEAGKPIPELGDEEAPAPEPEPEPIAEPAPAPEIETAPEPIAEPEPAPEAVEEPELPEPPVEEPTNEEAPAEAEAEAAPEPPADTSSDDDDISPEDLLSEFEKMLG
jgi:hypothetical protein